MNIQKLEVKDERKHIIFRSKTRLNYQETKKITVKIAETHHEFEQAFSLLQDSYVEEGLAAQSSEKYRVTFHHLLPSTSVIIAKIDGKVAGTSTLIRRSSWKLPLESLFDLSKYIQNGKQVAEVSGFAIDKKHRKTNSDVLFSIYKYILEYSTLFFGIDSLVLTCNPRHMNFFEGVMLFQRLPEGFAQIYNFVNGAPAAGAYLDLATANKRYKEIYGSLSSSQNLHEFIFETYFPNFKFPARQHWNINDLNMSPDFIKSFACEKTKLLQHLTSDEMQHLYTVYPYDLYRSVLPDRRTKPRISDEKNKPCFDVLIKGELLPYKKSWPVTLEIRSIFENGFKAHLPNNKLKHQSFINEGVISFQLNKYTSILLDIERIEGFDNENQMLVDYHLKQKNSDWQDIFHSIATSYEKIAA